MPHPVLRPADHFEDVEPDPGRGYLTLRLGDHQRRPPRPGSAASFTSREASGRRDHGSSRVTSMLWYTATICPAAVATSREAMSSCQRRESSGHTFVLDHRCRRLVLHG